MYKFTTRFLALIMMSGWMGTVSAQEKMYLPNAHSHNDYSRPGEFYKAYHDGFGSIEADIFLYDGKLVVAHDRKDIRPDRTLKLLYLDPIKTALTKDTSRRLTLLIDVKEDYNYILPQLIAELRPLLNFCKGYNAGGRLQILISGNRPLPTQFGNYPAYLYFDDVIRPGFTSEQLKRVAQISLKYSVYSTWKGAGAVLPAEKARLKRVVDSVHVLGKPIRFWDAPDNPDGWNELIALGVDVIGTDKVDELAAFLEHRNNHPINQLIK
ncbi:hypothetical protein ACFGVR_20205 [Mucilaginibacter sp. AW1-3]